MSTTVAPTTPTFGERLRAARKAAGLQLDDAAYEARRLLPPSMRLSRETIRRYEVNLVPETKASIVYLAALAEVYKVDLIDLAPLAVKDGRIAKAVIRRLPRTTCFLPPLPVSA